MKIWLINHFGYAPDQSAGTRHYQLARELLQRGHDPVVIASSFYHKGRTEARLRGNEPYARGEIDGVRYIWLRTPPYKVNPFMRLRNMLAFVRALKRMDWVEDAGRPEVILGSSPSLFAAEAARKVARRLSTPFLLEIRDLWPDSLVELGNYSTRNPVIWWLRRLERRLYRNADQIITVLPNSASHMRSRGGHEATIVWIPNGVSFDLVPQPEPPAAKKKITIIYAGAHGLYNGLDTILDCAKILQREGWSPRALEIQLIGDGPRKQGLVARAKEENISLIRFLPPVPKHQIYQNLACADAFLMTLRPSPIFKYGISPNKLWDYMAMARPVIFAASCQPDPVAEAEAGFSVPPNDPKAMARAIQRFGKLNYGDRIELGQRARAHVEKYHDFEKLTDDFLQTIDQVRRNAL